MNKKDSNFDFENNKTTLVNINNYAKNVRKIDEGNLSKFMKKHDEIEVRSEVNFEDNQKLLVLCAQIGF